MIPKESEYRDEVTEMMTFRKCTFSTYELYKKHNKDLKGNNDLLNLTQPGIIKEIHKSFLVKGCDFIQTNTFNSSSISQKDYDLQEKAYDLNCGYIGKDFCSC